MSWQELVFTLGNIIMIIALIPSIVSKDKPAYTTSLMTGTILALFSLAYFSLHFYSSALVLISPEKLLYNRMKQLVQEKKWKVVYYDMFSGVFVRNGTEKISTTPEKSAR